MEEELFVQFNKIANSILHSKSKEQENVVEARSRENSEVAPDKESELKAKSSPPSVTSPEDKIPFMKVKALQVSKQIWFQFPSIKSLVESLKNTFLGWIFIKACMWQDRLLSVPDSQCSRNWNNVKLETKNRGFKKSGVKLHVEAIVGFRTYLISCSEKFTTTSLAGLKSLLLH